MTSYVKIDEIKIERLDRPFSGNYNTELEKLEIRNKDDKYWSEVRSEETNDILIDISEKIIEADRNKNYILYNKYKAFSNLIYVKFYMSRDKIQFNAAEKQIKENWDNVSDGVKYEEISISYDEGRNYLMEFEQINNSKFYNYLYNNDLEIFYKDEMNNISFLYNYMMDILPMLLIIFTIILMYNSINIIKSI